MFRILLCSMFMIACSKGADKAPARDSDKTAPVSVPAKTEAKPADTVPAPPATPPSRLELFENAEGLYGYRDADGKEVIAAKYTMAGEFSAEGLAGVVDDKGWMIIDRMGRRQFEPFIFDNGPDPFADGLARMVRDGKVGFYDATGKIVIEPTYDFAGPFADGVAEVCMGCEKKMDGEHWSMVGGQWGKIDKTGAFVEALYDAPPGKR